VHQLEELEAAMGSIAVLEFHLEDTRQALKELEEERLKKSLEVLKKTPEDACAEVLLHAKEIKVLLTTVDENATRSSSSSSSTVAAAA
jgi:hypothetical protein